MNDTLRWSSLFLALCLTACASDPAPTTVDGDVTWYGDVAHVAHEKCMSCHNDDAPTFSMATFTEDLAARASLMVAYVEDGTMPPWKPSDSCNSYVDERRLTDDEKALFRAWAEAGALAGDPAQGPPPRGERVGLARADRRLEMPAAYTPAPPEGDVNDLRCFVLDPGVTETEQLIGFDILPGDMRVVHHVLLYLADASEVDARDAEDPSTGYNCPGGPGVASAQVIAGWVPGMPAASYPAETGVPFEAGKKLVLQMHYNTQQAGPLPDRTAVELMFSDTPMRFAAIIEPLRDADFVIPPQTTDFTTSVSLSVPQAATLWALLPHMHLMGRRAQVELARADGTSECLLDIPSWDFDWQQFYFFQRPIRLEAGDRVTLSCTFDNDSSREVRWGEDTEDEMCISYGYVTGGHVD